MNRSDLDPELDRLGDALRASTTIDLAREERVARPSAARTRRPRSRVLAGSTLGAAGLGAALVLALGGSAAAPAFAVTKQANGSVLVRLNLEQNLPQVNAKLAAMGTGEQVTIYEAAGPATVSGPVTCTPAKGAASPSGPQVQILQGTDGTEVISAGETGDNTGEGTFHLASCTTSVAGSAGNSGSASSDVRHVGMTSTLEPSARADMSVTGRSAGSRTMKVLKAVHATPSSG
jgi:hypothetical protein